MTAPRNLYGVDLNLLVALEALVNERSVTKAAIRLGITQSAMSNALSRLRRLFGDEILVRVGRQWELTPRAKSMRDPLERMLQIGRDEILQPSPFEPSVADQRFTIATANASVVSLIAPLVARLATVAPGISLRLIPADRPFDALLDRTDVDLMILPDHFGVKYPNTRLISMTWTCVVDAGHPLRGPRSTPEEFAAYPHVVYEHTGVTSNAQAVIAAQSSGGPVRVVVDDFVVIPFLLPGTELIGILQDVFAENLVASMGLRSIEPPMLLPALNIHLYWHPRNHKEPANVWLRETLVDVAGEVRRSSPSSEAPEVRNAHTPV